MRWLRRNLFMLLFVLVPCSAAAQDSTVEYGTTGELRGVTKVFVDTGKDIRQRDQIIKELQRSLPGLTVVSRPEDAEVHLQFKIVNYTGTVFPIEGTATSEGVGAVVRIVGPKRARVLMSFRDVRKLFERKPSTNFARQFVRAYRKANR